MVNNLHILQRHFTLTMYQRKNDTVSNFNTGITIIFFTAVKNIDKSVKYKFISLYSRKETVK